MLPSRRLFRPQNVTAIPINHNSAWMRAARSVRQSRSYTSSQLQGPLFTYRLGVSASGKASLLRRADHGHNFWTQSVLDREPSYFSSAQKDSGEDAFFVAYVARSNRHVVLGVADGVGGWQDQGINPAKFSHGLCRYMAEATYRPEKEEDLKPKHILQKAYDQVQRDRSILAGGSTASIATISPEGQMEVANLGDSGFVVLKPGKVAYKSEPQTHAFNTPYQLSKLTPRMQAQRSIFGGAQQIAESPAAADSTYHDLRHGDIILFASDGVWDNLSAMEILNIVAPIMEKEGHWMAGKDSQSPEAAVNADSLRKVAQQPASPENDLLGRLAYAVMREAKLTSHDQKRDGPFAKEVHRNFPGEEYHGGKVDDITVVVGLAIQDGSDESLIKAKL